ncbi:hypothetical protein ACFPRL_18370 [Pseudoclavibacter helvolus]
MASSGNTTRRAPSALASAVSRAIVCRLTSASTVGAIWATATVREGLLVMRRPLR